MTAVEWLVNELKCIKSECGNQTVKIEIKGKLLKQAKAMEKEAHQETWDSAHQAGRFEGKGIAEPHWQTFETYWDETFKSE